MLNKSSATSYLRRVLLAIALVFGVYTILPTVVAAGAMFLAACIAIAQKGTHFFSSTMMDKYALNLEGFSGELALLAGSGILALIVWSRRNDLQILGRSVWWRDVLLGIGTGAISFFLIKRFVLPGLYLARPLGSEWVKAEYHSLGGYGSSSMNWIADKFFLNAFYSPVVETIVFVGLLYQALRLKWGATASLMLASAIFAVVHQNQVLILDFFLIGLINFALYEFRKLLAPPLFYHLTYNIFVFGSQLLSFENLS